MPGAFPGLEPRRLAAGWSWEFLSGESGTAGSRACGNAEGSPETSPMRRISREGGIGVAVSALTVGAMAIDHLIGTEDEPGDDPGLADPTAFLISVAISLLLAALLFGVVVRRAARDDPGRVANKGACVQPPRSPRDGAPVSRGALSLAGAGIALGLLGRESARSGLATAAIAIGVLVTSLGAGAYVAALVA